MPRPSASALPVAPRSLDGPTRGPRLIEAAARSAEVLAFSADGSLLAWGASSFADGQGQIVVLPLGQAVPKRRIALPSPGFLRLGALALDHEGGMLVGELLAESRFTEHAYLRLSAEGSASAPCRASPPGVGRGEWAQPRGVVSLVELADGRVVSGGPDDSFAVWSAEGCAATWPRGPSCCRSESAVMVARAPQPGAFLTLGETRWVDEEHGGMPLGPRRWQGPPWTVASVRLGFDVPARPLLAVAADGSCIASVDDRKLSVVAVLAAGSEVPGASSPLPGRTPRRVEMDLPGRPEHVAVAPGCAAVAFVLADGLWLCRESDCLPP